MLKKVIVFPVLLLIFVLFYNTASFEQENPESLFLQGTELLRNGDPDDTYNNDVAITILDKVISALKDREFQGPLSSADKLLLSDALNNRGLAYYNRGGSINYSSAMNDFIQAKTYNPKDFKSLGNIGMIYFVQGIYFRPGKENDAIDWYTEAIGQIQGGIEKTTDLGIYLNLGVSFMKKDPPDLAEAKKKL